MTLVLPRRRFLTGLIGLVAAPAVVRAEVLMPIKVWTPPRDSLWGIPPFAVLSSEDPSEWSESDWRLAKAEAALPPQHRTMAGELYLALRADRARTVERTPLG
jgi:hypothetical protein